MPYTHAYHPIPPASPQKNDRRAPRSHPPHRNRREREIRNQSQSRRLRAERGHWDAGRVGRAHDGAICCDDWAPGVAIIIVLQSSKAEADACPFEFESAQTQIMTAILGT